MQTKVQGNVFTFLQIFNAIPSPSFSAPAELHILNPTAVPYVMLMRISHLWNCRAQYLLGIRQCRIPSQDGSGRLNLQCRSDISLHLREIRHSRHFGATSFFRKDREEKEPRPISVSIKREPL
jgi:hypothetical protein